MSDFLTRMARLSRGEAAVIAPRLPSRFAPMPETGLAETVEILVEQHGGTESARKPTRAPFSPASDLHAAPPVTTGKGLGDQLIKVTPGRPDLGMEQASAPPDAPPGHLDDASGIPAPLLAAALKPTSPKIKGAVGQAGVRNESGDSHTASDLLHGSLQNPPAAEVDMEAVRLVESREQAGGSLRRMSPPLVPGHHTQQRDSQQLMAELPTAVEQAARQEPTVHINIGLVEVRAHTAAPIPAPRPSRPKPQSSLSLDDYLKRGRSQDGRA